MVILGGLEIVAAGYLLNEFNKDKVEARERRKHDRPHHEDRPQSRPPRHDEQHVPQHLQSTHLAPPSYPPRPLSAPPDNVNLGPMPGPLQRPQQPGPMVPGSPYPFQTQLQNSSPRPQGSPAPFQQGQSSPQPQFNARPPPLGPGGLPNPNAFPPQQPPPPYSQNQPQPPGPGLLQHANTFSPQSFQQTSPPPPFMQSSQTFPIQSPQQQFHPPSASMPSQQQPFKPAPQGPLVYIDTKTGKVSHNLYPPDHPMARGTPHEVPKELWGDQKYVRAMAGDINTGLVWSEKDDDDLAYGKDYSSSRRSGRRERS